MAYEFTCPKCGLYYYDNGTKEGKEAEKIHMLKEHDIKI